MLTVVHKPKDYGYVMTDWTHQNLAEAAVKQGVVETISASYTGRLLKKNELQPHKSKYWLFPKIKNWKAFVVRVGLICQLVLGAVQERFPKRHVLSIDEKTGIQGCGFKPL